MSRRHRPSSVSVSVSVSVPVPALRLIRRAAGAVAASLALAASATPMRAPAPRLATLPIPGHAAFVAIARDVLAVQADYQPDFASQAGLMDDAAHVPSFAPARVAALVKRLDADLAALRALPWRGWSVDEQIDVRWMAANAERMKRELTVEKLWTHRPGQWLETTANVQISLLTYAPSRTDALDAVSRGIPGLVREMGALCVPTKADVEVATGLVDGLLAVLQQHPTPSSPAAIAALRAYRERLSTAKPAQPFQVVGEASFAWRLRHAELLPWSPAELRARAQARLDEVDAELAQLKPRLPEDPPPLTPAQKAEAAALDQPALLALYDRIQQRNREAVVAGGFVTIPAGVGPVKARVTPDAMVPLTGDGGSMNPPPPFLPDDTGWWNVEHFDPRMSAEDREDNVREAEQYQLNGMGPYAAHEGWPGHHLQLAIARLHADPLRSLFQDNVLCEGWGLYAEQVMWEHGGLGETVQSRAAMLRSWRSRIRRVIYDVDVETGRWTLQQAADWKHAAKAPGEGEVDPDLLRTINWPAQLVAYFTGKEQILQLKADYRRAKGAAYSERRFHDELLALGSVPLVFARAKLLGEPVPAF